MHCKGVIAIWTLNCMISAAALPKALIIVPGYSTSNLIFFGKVAETLSRNGFNVTQLVMMGGPEDWSKAEVDGVTTIIVDVDPTRQNHWRSFGDTASEALFVDAPVSKRKIEAAIDLLSHFTVHVLRYREIFAQLREEKFDIGYANQYHFASVGILEAVGINTTVLLSSWQLTDHIYWFLGCPVPWSFVPSIVTDLSDEMSIRERIVNALMHSALLYMYNYRLVTREQRMFRETFGPEFPDLTQLSSKYQLVMINADELIDFPRPTLHNIQYIGGLGMSTKDAEPLDKHFDVMLSKGRDGVIIFSLGTVADSSLMPTKMKTEIFGAFERLAEYHFIVAFKGDVHDAVGIKNVDIVPWLPQKRLLNDNRTKLFITQGGMNSILEATTAGVPMVIMPLFVDQMANGRRAERAGVGVSVDIRRLTQDSLYEAMTNVLNDSRYRNRATRLARMMARKPESAESRLVKWSQFLVEFGNLDNLKPASAGLSIVKYLYLDVLFTLLTVLVTFAYACKLGLRLIKKSRRSLSPKKTQ